ncbi:MAG: sulfotransferase [Xanthomonadales bacterium]|nr:sulfotransferase [Xanthomonadales bacterium]
MSNFLTFIFIVGSQRSGTTLAGQILGAHPNVLLIDEEDHLYEWLNAALVDNYETTRTAFEACCALARRKYWKPEERASVVGKLSPKISHIVLKAPNATYSDEAIASAFPAARIVYLVRDIRGVVASMQRLSHIPMVENQLRLMQTAPHICRDFVEYIRVLSDPSTPRHKKMALIALTKMSLADRFRQAGLDVMSLKYEDLVANTEAVVSLLVKHCGLPDNPLCLSHTDVFQGLGPGKTDRNRSIDKASVTRWANDLDRQQIQDVWDITAEFLLEQGYTEQFD